MKLPRDLSGEELVKHLCKRWEYQKIHQVGKPNIPFDPHAKGSRPHRRWSRRIIPSESAR